MIADPPLLAGAVHETDAEPSPAVAFTAVGESGVVRGVALRADEASELPTAFTARTSTE